MGTPLKCVFDLTVGVDGVPPRRPGLDDVGGGQKQNDPNPAFVPNPVTMPTAQDENQAENLLVRYGSVVPHTIVSVHLDGGGNPVMSSVSSCVGGVTATPGSPFTVVTHGAGDFSLTWAANTLPNAVADHEASATGSTGGTATAQTLTNEVRVRTFTTANVAQYLPCNVKLY